MSSVATHTQSITTTIFQMFSDSDIVIKKRLTSSFQIHTTRRSLSCLPNYHLRMMAISICTFLRYLFLYQLQQLVGCSNSISTNNSYHIIKYLYHIYHLTHSVINEHKGLFLTYIQRRPLVYLLATHNPLYISELVFHP